MMKSMTSKDLRTRLNDLDSLLIGAPARRSTRPLAAKQFEGTDAILGSRG